MHPDAVAFVEALRIEILKHPALVTLIETNHDRAARRLPLAGASCFVAVLGSLEPGARSHESDWVLGLIDSIALLKRKRPHFFVVAGGGRQSVPPKLESGGTLSVDGAAESPERARQAAAQLCLGIVAALALPEPSPKPSASSR
jgi:hypothetical protein